MDDLEPSLMALDIFSEVSLAHLLLDVYISFDLSCHLFIVQEWILRVILTDVDLWDFLLEEDLVSVDVIQELFVLLSLLLHEFLGEQASIGRLFYIRKFANLLLIGKPIFRADFLVVVNDPNLWLHGHGLLETGQLILVTE